MQRIDAVLETHMVVNHTASVNANTTKKRRLPMHKINMKDTYLSTSHRTTASLKEKPSMDRKDVLPKNSR